MLAKQSESFPIINEFMYFHNNKEKTNATFSMIFKKKPKVFSLIYLHVKHRLYYVEYGKYKVNAFLTTNIDLFALFIF